MTPTLLDLIEEPLNQVTRAKQVRAEADRIFAIALRSDIGRRAFLADKLPDLVCIVSTIRE
jgi:hypothetical protein